MGMEWNGMECRNSVSGAEAERSRECEGHDRSHNIQLAHDCMHQYMYVCMCICNKYTYVENTLTLKWNYG
jgi:hypothetical protein